MAKTNIKSKKIIVLILMMLALATIYVLPYLRYTFYIPLQEAMNLVGERKNGVNAEAGRGQNVCHNGHAVAVAAGHLQDRLHARVFKRDAKAERGCFQGRGLHIRDVHGVNLRGKQPAGFQLLCKIIALRGRHLGSHAELTVFECFF